MQRKESQGLDNYRYCTLIDDHYFLWPTFADRSTRAMTSDAETPSALQIRNRTFLVVLKLADVGAVDLRSVGELLLRQFGVITGFTEFFTEHPSRVSQGGLHVR